MTTQLGGSTRTVHPRLFAKQASGSKASRGFGRQECVNPKTCTEANFQRVVSESDVVDDAEKSRPQHSGANNSVVTSIRQPLHVWLLLARRRPNPQRPEHQTLRSLNPPTLSSPIRETSFLPASAMRPKPPYYGPSAPSI